MEKSDWLQHAGLAILSAGVELPDPAELAAWYDKASEVGAAPLDDWIEWRGMASGAQPPYGAPVEVRYANGTTEKNDPEAFAWDHVGDGEDVIAYRKL